MSLLIDKAQPSVFAREVCTSFLLWLQLALLGVFLNFSSLLQAQPAALEYQVKGAYLFNFSKYITWPADKVGETNSPIIIGILGNDPFGPTLDEMMEKKTVNGHKLKIQRETSAEKLKGAHIVFISRSMDRHLDKTIEAFKGSPTLLVSDIARFSRRSGMIGFVFVGRTVRFEINRDNAERSGLKISGQLLSVATVVYTEKTAGGEGTK